jgi:enterochelin esterase-like enzyme
VERFQLSSSASAIYPRDVRSGNVFARAVALYVPSGYVSGAPLPFMVVQDGTSWDDRIIPVLDNLIATQRLPKMAAVFVNPGPGDGPGSQRGLEYDTVSDRYLTFVESELLPRLAADYAITFTSDPEGRAAFGCSSGAAAAFTMGWFRPDLYRRIMSYSGTFVAQARSAEYPDGAWEYHETLIPNSERKPLRVFLEVGENDNGRNDQGTHNWVRANQAMSRELGEKGYHRRYVFAEDAGHCDGRVVGQTLPDAMLWLWRGFLG